MIQSIERIKPPARDVFIRDYLLAQRPVIITGLFEGQPIARLRTLEAARAKLGSMRVLIYEGFEDTFTRLARTLLSGNPSHERRKEEETVESYLRRTEADPKTRIICSQVPEEMLVELRPLYRLPDYCLTDAGEPDDFHGELWLGNAGNYSHLHFDDDQRNILQYQLFGRKRVLLVEPRHSRKLLPIQTNTMVSPEGLSEQEMEDFARYVHGYQCILEPGDTLFMPALVWHWFQYLETSMSLTMRFRRNRYNRFLATNLQPDYRVQSLGFKLADEARADPRCVEAFGEIERACRGTYATPLEKGRTLHRLLDELHVRTGGDGPKGTYARPFVDVLIDQVDHMAFPSSYQAPGDA
jgi:hypothetical protein